jgi:WD40 repeat protein
MNREALVVGINRYPFLRDKATSPARHLKTPADDAEAIAQILETYGNFKVERLPVYEQDGAWRVDPNPLPGKSVNMSQLKEAIANLFNPPGKSIPDTALLFFAGHGLRDHQGGISEGYLATSDACPQQGQWGVSLHWLRELLQKSPVRQQIVWLDCCHSGELHNFEEAHPGNRGIARNRSLIAACRDFEAAYEEFGGNHGVLTSVLLTALNPDQHPDGWVTNYSLVDFIQRQLQTSRQRPLFYNIGSEMILTGKKEKIDRAVLMEGRCPYKGLSYFDCNEEDPQYFYGRTALTDQLLEKVRTSNFLAVMGASGSGKSSVVRAGLLYQLKLGQKLAASERWVIKIFRPGEHPLDNLAEVFAQGKSANGDGETELTTLRTSIDQGAVGLKNLVQTTARNGRLVLIADQFEEVFTLCQDETERQQFFACLLGALEITDNQLCLILTMRADFFGKCAEQEYAGLARKIEQNLVAVTPMNREELEQAITEPAKKVGLEIERELVTQMLMDVAGPGSLPLLQYTLTEMWRQRQVPRLTLAQYTRLGAVKGTLRKRADEVYQSLSEAEQLAAKRIFLELTKLGEGTEDTRRQVFKPDLINEQQSAELVDTVLRKLSDARLVVTSELEARGEGSNSNTVTVVDVAHESLIRHWTQLRQWVDDNREAIRIERKLESAAAEWENQGKPQDIAFLLQGAKLAEAEDFLQNYLYLGQLNRVAQEYIKVSQDFRNRLATEKEEQLQREQERSAALERALKKSTLLSQAARVRDLLPIQPLESVLLAIQSIGLNQTELPETILSRVKNSLLRGIEVAREQNILRGHQDKVTSVAISPDSQMIVSGSQDGTVRLWDTQGNPIGQSLQGHQDAVTSVAISPDGQVIASGSQDRTVRLWDTQGHSIGEPFRRHEDRGVFAIFRLLLRIGIRNWMKTIGWLSGVSLVSDILRWFIAIPLYQPNQRMCKFGYEICPADWYSFFIVLLFDLILFSWIAFSFFRKREGGLTSIAFSPDGKCILTGSHDKTVRLWNRQGKLIGAPLYGHKATVTSVTFSPDGKYIVSGSEDKTLRLWTLRGKLLSASSKTHEDGITSVAFSPDGDYIVSGFQDKTLRLWDYRKGEKRRLGEKLRRLLQSCFRHWVSIIGWFSIGSFVSLMLLGIAMALLYKPICQVDISGECPQADMYAFLIVLVLDLIILVGIVLFALKRIVPVIVPMGKPLVGHEHDITSVAISSDGQTIISGSSDKTIRLWDKHGNPIGQTFVGHEDAVTSVAISPDSQFIVSGSSDQTVRLWDKQDNPIGQRLLRHDFPVTAVAISPDREYIVSGSGDQTVRLWDTQGNLICQPFVGHEDAVTTVAISPDGEYIVSGSQDKTLRLWDRQGNPLGQPCRGHEDAVTTVAISPDGEYIVSGSADQTLRVWDQQGNPISRAFTGHEQAITAVAISSDSQYIVSGSVDRTIRLWDRQGNSIGQPFRGHQEAVTAIAISPDGESIISGSGDKTIRLWTRQGNLMGQPFKGHEGTITAIAISPDGQTIISASQDKTVRLWDCQGNPIGEPLRGHQDFVTSVAISPDGQTIISGSEDKTIWLWQNHWQSWLAVACKRLRNHPSLKNPETEEEKKACEICQTYGLNSNSTRQVVI